MRSGRYSSWPGCKIARQRRRAAATPFAQLPRPLAVCSCVAQSVVVYETNFHKIALYPPWAGATVPRLQNAAPTIASARQYLLISHKISHI